jgi:hypothetical protein
MDLAALDRLGGRPGGADAVAFARLGSNLGSNPGGGRLEGLRVS